MSILAEVTNALGGGVLGTTLGGVLGVGQKIVTTVLEHRQQRAEWEHERELQELNNQRQEQKEKLDLVGKEIQSFGEMRKSSYEHDMSFKPATGVDNIRALVRPGITGYALVMAHFNPAVYLELASMMVTWWFSSRVKVEKFL